MKNKRIPSATTIGLYAIKKFKTPKELTVGLAVLAAAIIFHSIVASTIKSVLVDPVFSKIQPTIWIELVVIALGIITLGSYILATLVNRRLSIGETASWLTLSILYLPFRVGWYSEFHFIRFSATLPRAIALLDILIIPAIGILVHQVVLSLRRSKPAENKGTGFYYDQAVAISSSEDHFERMPFVDLIAIKIRETETVDQSFAIGIVGKWGSGKTTFMDTLRDKFRDDPGVIQISFNPWKSANSTGFTKSFFKTLANEVAVFDRNVKATILEYAREIVESVEGKELGFIKTVLRLSAPKGEAATQYKEINKSLARIGRKIIVYVDDVDRLDKIEVLEVLRIIRNTASFKNVFFVVAYDKSYLTDSINDALVSHSHRYLEKIFQLEFNLPLYPTKSLVRKRLRTELDRIFSLRDRNVLDQLEAPVVGLRINEFFPPLAGQLTNLRDVARYLNIILTTYDRVKENVYIPDYLAINLVRLKYPEVYNLLYMSKLGLLGTGEHTQFFDLDSGRLVLKSNGTEGRTYQHTELYQYLKQWRGRLALSEEDLERSAQLVEDIFSLPSKMLGHVERRNFSGANLSIVNHNTFERYFDFLLTERLQEQSFREIMEKDLTTIQRAFTQWCVEVQIGVDLQDKLIHYDKALSWDEFQKYIRAIVFYAGLPHPGGPYSYGYEYLNFYNRFYRAYQQERVYSADQVKAFYLELYEGRSINTGWEFIHSFTYFLFQKGYDGQFVLSPVELIDAMVKSLSDALMATSQLYPDLIGFYSQMYYFLHQPIPSNGTEIEHLRKLMIAKVERDMPDFIRYIISRNPRSKEIEVSVVLSQVYLTDEEFIKALERLKSNPAVGEFLGFYRNRTNQTDRKMEFAYYDV